MKLLNPNFFLRYYALVLPLLILLFVPIFSFAIYQALIISPPDYQQGELVRIMYVHVPSAWLALAIYTFMACCSFANLVWANRLAYILAAASAPIGASFSVICLATGSIWGRLTWGAWWVWDARLTSMLILLMFYIAYIAVFNQHRQLAAKSCSVISLIGFINVPIVKFCVNIWNNLHQGASVFTLSGPKIDAAMLKPLFLMFAAFSILFLFLIILRTASLIADFKLENRGFGHEE